MWGIARGRSPLFNNLSVAKFRDVGARPGLFLHDLRVIEVVALALRVVARHAAADPVLREPGRTVATLHINFHGLKEEFTTENLDQRGARIDMKLVSGPFRSLEGSWSFTGLGEKGCKVEFRLRYEFSSAILERAIGPVFRGIADGLVEAFVRRAAQKYGRT